jgi:hypothetical protein
MTKNVKHVERLKVARAKREICTWKLRFTKPNAAPKLQRNPIKRELSN